MGRGGQGDIMLVADRVVLLQNTAEQRCKKPAFTFPLAICMNYCKTEHIVLVIAMRSILSPQ